MPLIQVAVPVILALIALEAGLARRQHRRVHDTCDLITDFGCAVMSQVVGIVVAALTVMAYRETGVALAEAGWPLRSWPLASPVAWLAAFVLVDLIQYTSHRLAHRVNLLWACHLVHHSSREMNLAVGIRNTSFQGFFNVIFFLPGPLLGVPWQMAATCYGANVLYQFWLHTRLVGRLGPLEAVLNTPSHHRVHHGIEDRYIDRNFGGVLIVWDRLFGTFRAEDTEPTYGTVSPVPSWNPVWANFHGFACIAATWRHGRTWRERWLAVFGPPESLMHPDPTAPAPAPSRLVVGYAAFQLLLATAVTIAVVLPTHHAALTRLAGAAFVMVSLMVIGGLLDGRRWAWATEGVRLAVIGVVVLARG